MKKAPTNGRRLHQSGVGGVRTLVQTMSFQAFYMLISWLVFDSGKDKNTRIHRLNTEILQKLSVITFASPKF